MVNLYSRETVKKIYLVAVNIFQPKKRLKNNTKKNVLYSTKKHETYLGRVCSIWKTHQKTTNKNNEGRETVIALPNELANDTKKLKIFCDNLAKSLYERKNIFMVCYYCNSRFFNNNIYTIT